MSRGVRADRAGHKLSAFLVLIGLILFLSGCAEIPTETPPQPLNFGGMQDNGLSVPQPPKDATPPNIVRGFVGSSADPADHHAAARVYLADSLKSSWSDNGPVVIIGDTFNTVTPFGAQDLLKNGSDYDVLLRGQLIGQVGVDHGFRPGSGDYQLQFRLARQSDGSWRIVDPPDAVVLTQSAFERYYQPVELYFFDPSFGVLVPDQRYVDTDPASGVPGRIIDLLLSGPSSALSGAVKSAIPSGVGLQTNVIETSDGATMVNLTQVAELSDAAKQQIAAQIVKSLQGVTNGPVRIESDGVALITNRSSDWRLTDLPPYSELTTPKADLPGLVVTHGKMLSLRDGAEIPGTVGNGGCQVTSAAQSIDGNQLATVCRAGDGVQLRVGPYGRMGSPVDLTAGKLTRPTWMPADAPNEPSNEVWTVANGQVVRVVNTLQGTWVATPVDASAVTRYGPITDLRLSRDGVRVAAVAGGYVVVGAVVVQQSSVMIKDVARLQADTITGAVGVDWVDQDSVVVATSQPTMPVVLLSADGLMAKPYNTSNLTAPMTAVAAAADRSVVVVDSTGMWESPDRTEVWQALPHNQGADAIPFYPG